MRTQNMEKEKWKVVIFVQSNQAKTSITIVHTHAHTITDVWESTTSYMWTLICWKLRCKNAIHQSKFKCETHIRLCHNSIIYFHTQTCKMK